MSTISYNMSDIIAGAIDRLMASADVSHHRQRVAKRNPMAANIDDLADVNASLNGDGQAYARIIARHQDAIAARMWRFTRDRTMLEELVHDVFVQAYFSLRTWRARSPLRHWLNKIATRCGYRFWTKQSQQQAVPLADWDGADRSNVTSEMESQEAAYRLHKILGRLPPRDRLVITLLHIEQLSIEEIAEQTGWSKVMVKVQAWRARKKLQAILAPEFAGEIRRNGSDARGGMISSEKRS